ncbi:hypothetical protein OE749_08360 [Aestuariibacter sp. AA17]|uniref:Uncharacterized protein n=1 Tax=Fluctibacter corallii TaxID=2984329 RepID=A0ABT3A8V9_9ALTE|nr:hypothetical protein [Aestuariibacter sp. AA17]MCV2884707.1 hypothetical protein [Aestuariibacter sp. AA17]
MKVKCVNLVDDKGLEIEKSSWLTVGKLYPVLSLIISESGNVEYRLLSDDGATPAIFDASFFEIESESIPHNWVVSYFPGVYFELTPKGWVTPSFWDDFFEGDKDAVGKFLEEKIRFIKINIFKEY